MKLRFAAPEDAEALLAIYACYIDTPITYEEVLPSPAAFAGRIREIGSVYPYLVAEEDGRILGYAYAHKIHERAAYQWSAELSVYLAPEARGRGLGTRFYTVLIALLRLMGVRTVTALVTLPNERSERLHRRMGFTPLCVYRHSGFKAGAWHDTCYFERQLGPYDAPAPLRPVGKLDPAAVAAILEKEVTP